MDKGKGGIIEYYIYPYLADTLVWPSDPTATRGQTLSPEGPTRHPEMSRLSTSIGITSGKEAIEQSII